MKNGWFKGIIATGIIGAALATGLTLMDRNNSVKMDADKVLSKYSDGSVILTKYGVAAIGLKGKEYSYSPVEVYLDENGDGLVDYIRKETPTNSLPRRVGFRVIGNDLSSSKLELIDGSSQSVILKRANVKDKTGLDQFISADSELRQILKKVSTMPPSATNVNSINWGDVYYDLY